MRGTVSARTVFVGGFHEAFFLAVVFVYFRRIGLSTFGGLARVAQVPPSKCVPTQSRWQASHRRRDFNSSAFGGDLFRSWFSSCRRFLVTAFDDVLRALDEFVVSEDFRGTDVPSKQLE